MCRHSHRSSGPLLTRLMVLMLHCRQCRCGSAGAVLVLVVMQLTAGQPSDGL